MESRQVLFRKGDSEASASMRLGIAPYIVSGALSRGDSAVGVIGATLHVSAWTLSCLFSVIAFSYLDFDTHRAAFEASVFQLCFLLSSLVLLLGIALFHAVTRSIRPGSLAPWISACISGGALLSWAFWIHLLNNTPGDGFYTPDPRLPPSEIASKASDYRLTVLSGLASNTFVLTFLVANLGSNM